MKLLYLVPGTMDRAEQERRCAILQSYAFEGTQVDVSDTVGGPNSIESMYEEYWSVKGTVERAVQAEQEGYDGIILGCYADPGIDALREMLTIPVAGPFESSCFTAMTMGHKFSIITVTPDMCPSLEEEFEAKGFKGRKMASVRAIDVDVLEIGEKPELVRERLLAQVEKAIVEDHADTIVLGCISLAFAGADHEIEERFGVPCINPIMTALKQCEGNVRMGFTHSKKAFATPRKLKKLMCNGGTE